MFLRGRLRLLGERQDKPAAGTSLRYRHGGDTPITRASIRAVQEERARRGRPALSAEQMAAELVYRPEPRHVRRVLDLT